MFYLYFRQPWTCANNFPDNGRQPARRMQYWASPVARYWADGGDDPKQL